MFATLIFAEPRFDTRLETTKQQLLKWWLGCTTFTAETVPGKAKWSLLWEATDSVVRKQVSNTLPGVDPATWAAPRAWPSAGSRPAGRSLAGRPAAGRSSGGLTMRPHRLRTLKLPRALQIETTHSNYSYVFPSSLPCKQSAGPMKVFWGAYALILFSLQGTVSPLRRGSWAVAPAQSSLAPPSARRRRRPEGRGPTDRPGRNSRIGFGAPVSRGAGPSQFPMSIDAHVELATVWHCKASRLAAAIPDKFLVLRGGGAGTGGANHNVSHRLRASASMADLASPGESSVSGWIGHSSKQQELCFGCHQRRRARRLTTQSVNVSTKQL